MTAGATAVALIVQFGAGSWPRAAGRAVRRGALGDQGRAAAEIQTAAGEVLDRDRRAVLRVAADAAGAVV